MVSTGVTFYLQWEVAAQVWLQNIFSSMGISIISFFSAFGEEMMMIAIIGFLYWCWDKEFGKFVAVNTVVALVANPLVKNIVNRRRPYFDIDNIKCFRKVAADADLYDIAEQGYSFPSGHSSNATVAYGSIAVYMKKAWVTICAVILILLVGFSRIVVGAHYITDVLGGWVLGIVVLAIVAVLQKKVSNKYILYAIFLVLGIPGFFYCTSTDFYDSYGMMVGCFTAILFEEKYVNFANTKNVIRIILRLAGGTALYFVLNSLLKLPFSKEFLESGTTAAMLVRTGRKAIVTFIIMGIYPMLFKYTAKIGKHETAGTAQALESETLSEDTAEAAAEGVVLEATKDAETEDTGTLRATDSGDSGELLFSTEPIVEDPAASRTTDEYMQWVKAQQAEIDNQEDK